MTVLSHKAKGFTLIEMMVVIVILGVFASVITVSVNSASQRKKMQYHQRLMNDLRFIRLVALGESQILGLSFEQANSNANSGYRLVGLNQNTFKNMVDNQESNSKTTKYGQFDGLSEQIDGNDDNKPSKKWELYATNMQKSIKRSFEDAVEFDIVPLEANTDHLPENTNGSFLEEEQNKPEVIWFGNGENSPVKIVMRIDNQQVGDPIFVNQIGQVSTNSSELGL